MLLADASTETIKHLWPFHVDFKIELPQLDGLAKVAEAMYWNGAIHGGVITAVVLIVLFLFSRENWRSCGLCLLASALLWYAGQRGQNKILPPALPATPLAPVKPTPKPKRPPKNVTDCNCHTQHCACECGCSSQGMCECGSACRCECGCGAGRDCNCDIEAKR